MNAESGQPATKADVAVLELRMLERMEASELRMLERMEASELRMLERMETIETRLLTAFQQWAIPVNGRLRKLETGDGVLDERLAMIEDRIMTIEKRLGAPPQRL